MENVDQSVWESIVTLAPFIVVGVSGGIFVFVILIAKFWGSTSEKIKSIEPLNLTIRRIDQSLSEIKGSINILESRMQKTEDAYVQSHSPISLTEKGIKISKEVKIEDSIAQKWDDLKDEIKEKTKGKNPYDIQEFLISLSVTNLEKMLDEDGIKRLKKKAYDEGVPLSALSRIVAVITRDKYFNEECIDHSEIDKCDPSKSKS